MHPVDDVEVGVDQRREQHHARGVDDHVNATPPLLRRAEDRAHRPPPPAVRHHGGELGASHYPVVLGDGSGGLAIVTHVGRPDEQLHDFGTGELLLIVAGPHGYISPSWYAEGTTPAPTWNFSVAHCYGVPE